MPFSKPDFLPKLLEFLSNANIENKELKNIMPDIFTKRDFNKLIMLNLSNLGIARLVIKTQDCLKLELLKDNYHISDNLELDININQLKNPSNSLLDILKIYYPKSDFKELNIYQNDKFNKKIIFIITNEIPKIFKEFYKKYPYKNYGLGSFSQYNYYDNVKESKWHYFTILSPFSAQIIKINFLINEKKFLDKEQINDFIVNLNENE